MGLQLWLVRARLNPPAESQAAAVKIRSSDQSIAPLSQLFSLYRPKYWYFDVIDLVRRIIMWVFFW